MMDILNLRGTLETLRTNHIKAKDALTLMEGTIMRIEALETPNINGLVVIQINTPKGTNINFQSHEKHYQERVIDILKEMLTKRLEIAHSNYEKATAPQKDSGQIA